jgi:hypothetical protein
VNGRAKGVVLPRSVALALREFINALGKATMYPVGHRFTVEAAVALSARLAEVVAERAALTLGILPRGLLLDGAAVDPLPPVLREFAARLHRKNIGTIHVAAGVSPGEVGEMLAALAAPDADEVVGRNGWRGHAIRVEPLVYDVLGFGDSVFEQELDEAFWGQLVEAAFGRRLSDSDGIPTPAQLAEAINERVASGPTEARRVFEALASFSSAIASRGERGTGSARKRFTEVLAALSRPTQVRVVQGASSAVARRRFLADTLTIVPTALLLQLLESVAEADGEPISAQLRWLLGKLAVGPDGSTSATPGFTAQVLSLVDQWEGLEEEAAAIADDPRLRPDPVRVLALGLELERAAPLVCRAAVTMANRGQLADVLQLVDAPGNDRGTAETITAAVMDPGLLERLLAAPSPDFALIERVVTRTRETAVPVLLAALEAADSRTARRRLLDLLVHVGPTVEASLLARLDSAPWYLARNILGVLAQLPQVQDPQPVLRALQHPEARVRQEALKVLLRHPETRDRAIQEALEGGDEVHTRVALTSLGGRCPPPLVASVLSVLGHPNHELRLQAVRLLADTTSPLVVPQLLALVRTRGGLLRRTRLMPTTPLMLAALEILARRWANHRPVVAVLQLAARSNDPQVQAAVMGGA